MRVPVTIGRGRCLAALCVAAGVLFAAPGFAQETAQPAQAPALEPLPPPLEVDARQAALGRILFYDPKLSGDATLSCSECHQPDDAFIDGKPLSKGYSGSLYFRNTPTLLNVGYQKLAYWDGRLSTDNFPAIVRDHISEAHFMWADGRLVIERLRQVPEYERRFQEAFGDEPSYGRILNALTAYLKSLRSGETPYDRFLEGDESALTDQQVRGLELFRGKAGCVQCHHGPLLTDERFHNLGLGPAPAVFKEPTRHVTFRRFFRTLGVTDYDRLRVDIGREAVTKQAEDRGRFRTPSLREVSRTPPYMHHGRLPTLEDVVAFYNRGGGAGPNKDDRLHPLDLSDGDQAALVAFLESLASEPRQVEKPQVPDYELQPLGGED